MRINAVRLAEIKNVLNKGINLAPNVKSVLERSPKTDVVESAKTFGYVNLSLSFRFKTFFKRALTKLMHSSKNDVVKSLGIVKDSITPIEVPQIAKTKFLAHFITNGEGVENAIKNAEIDGFGHKGLPLRYPRKSFISDLDNLTKRLPEEKKQELFENMELNVNYNKKGKIVSYNGVPNIAKLDGNVPLNRKIAKIVTDFTLKNEVVSKDKNLNKAMNILINAVPEFTNIIGKQQHQTQKFCLDCHILKVLQLALDNKNYSKLRQEDKATMKMMILFHDISKKEGVVDGLHPAHSAIYSKNILGKFDIEETQKKRIAKMIKNHHWLEAFNKNRVTPENLAQIFSGENDYEIAKIFAESDLKGVSGDLFKMFGGALSHENQAPIENALRNIHSTEQKVA